MEPSGSQRKCIIGAHASGTVMIGTLAYLFFVCVCFVFVWFLFHFFVVLTGSEGGGRSRASVF